MKIVIVLNPSYEHLRTFVEGIVSRFATSGSSMHKGRNELKTFQVDGEWINVKQYRVPIFINRVVYSFFRKTKAYRAYYNGLEVMKRGISTAESIAYIECYQNELLTQSYYLSTQLLDVQEVRTFYYGPLEGNEAFYHAFARFTAQLHEKGICHLDYSPGNVLYQKQEDNYLFHIIDINRMKFVDMQIDEGCKNFNRMFDNDDVYNYLAAQYAQVRGYNTEQCIQLMNCYKDQFLQKGYRKIKRNKKLKSLFRRA